MYNLPFTYEELQEAVAQKRVTKRGHSSGRLHVYNYTDEVQYLNTWDDITLNCRGLIIDVNGNVVARPWKKFFNLGQINLPIQFDTPVEVMDKADGSLGILYPEPDLNACHGFGPHKIKYAIATRGSFDSSQAWHATKVWQQQYAEFYDDPAEAEVLKNYTILFEIIYPRNRVVLNYHGMDDLMLLGAVENETGYYLGPNTVAAMIAWPGPVVETYNYNTLSDALANMGRKNKEGYVVRSHNFLVKIKEPDYLDLHKLVTNLTPKTVWEKLLHGRSETEIISMFPDEFHDDVKAIMTPLVTEYERRNSRLTYDFWKTMQDTKAFVDGQFNRAIYAREIAKNPDKNFFFMLLDQKSIREALWKSLKPKEEVMA